MYEQLTLFLLHTSFHFFPRTFIDSERIGAQRQDHYHTSIKLFNRCLLNSPENECVAKVANKYYCANMVPNR